VSNVIDVRSNANLILQCNLAKAWLCYFSEHFSLLQLFLLSC